MANINSSKEVIYIINARGRLVGVSAELAKELLKKEGFKSFEGTPEEMNASLLSSDFDAQKKEKRENMPQEEEPKKAGRPKINK